ncbi:MAG: type IV pilin N-terminal domain-containing protein [Methanospirillum sp.]|nr:type IV pilin N-terminal domain-containing protein [Methanospirillum sp.]
MYKRDDAVSPVIGVILMVAITVILAAVIAAFVFGMAGGVDKTRVVSVVGERISVDEIKITNYGGQDAVQLLDGTDAFNVSINGVIVEADRGELTNIVGSIAYFEAEGPAGQDDVIVTGNFLDGKQSVIYSSKL